MMASSAPLTAWAIPGGENDGCAFINGHAAPCGAALKSGSSYCLRHYALTHVARGSEAEVLRLREIACVARIVGGRMGSGSILGPLPGEIEEIERRQLLAVIGPRRLGRAGRPSKLRT